MAPYSLPQPVYAAILPILISLSVAPESYFFWAAMAGRTIRAASNVSRVMWPRWLFISAVPLTDGCSRIVKYHSRVLLRMGNLRRQWRREAFGFPHFRHWPISPDSGD